MKSKKAFSIVEIIICITLFILVLFVLFRLVLHARYKEENSDKSLSYYLLASQLNYHLKNDLRAVYKSKIGKINGENRYTMLISYENKQKKILLKTIDYEFNEENKTITRLDKQKNQKNIFDFSDKLKKDENFKFQIFTQEIDEEFDTVHEFLHLAEITW